MSPNVAENGKNRGISLTAKAEVGFGSSFPLDFFFPAALLRKFILYSEMPNLISLPKTAQSSAAVILPTINLSDSVKFHS